MVVGSPGRSKEITTTDDWFTHPTRKQTRMTQLAKKYAIGNALETTEENDNE
jgi:hypothetical protein